MFETTCTLPLKSELFAQTVHPTSPLLAFGFASGHVRIDRLPVSDSVENGQGCIDTVWSTHRHKSSCRCLAFSTDGCYLFSAGSDGLLKCAQSDNGKVTSKIAVPQHDSKSDPPTLISSPNPQHVLLATDSSALHIYDLRTPNVSAKPTRTSNPHADYISSLIALPASGTSTSGFPRQFLTTGGTTIAITDLRKGVILESDEFDEELLCSAVVGNKTIVGSEGGALRILETGKWEEPPETYHLGRAGVEAVCAIPDIMKAGQGGDTAVCGMEDGSIRVLRLGKGKNRVIAEMSHDQIEAPASLGFLTGDAGGRMVSGGGRVIKVWEERGTTEANSDGLTNETVEESLDSDADDEGEGDSSEEEMRPQKRRKKSKRAKKGDKRGDHGVMAFTGME